MSDSQSQDLGGHGTPGRAAYDPASDTLPAPLQGVEPGPVVLLLDVAADRGWAADAAIALATAWSREGRRIVLADLHLEEPVLHERIGDGNLDGVVDIFLYGASLARSARPVPGRDFYLIPTGTYTPDIETVFSNPRWSKLVVGFRDANASLLLFAPGDVPEVGSLVQWANEVIVLGEGVWADEIVGRAESRAALVPPSAAGVDDDSTLETLAEDRTLEAGIGETPRSEDRPTEVDDEAFDEEFLDSYAAEATSAAEDRAEEPRITAAAVAGPAEAEDFDESYTQPIPNPPAPRRDVVLGVDGSDDSAAAAADLGRRRRHGAGRYVAWALLGLAAIAVIVYLLASMMGMRSPGPVPTPAGDAGAEPSGAVLESPPAASAEPVGKPLRYAVQVRAFTSLESAREHVTFEERRLGDVPFYISPERVQGILYYKVLAGFPADSVTAVALREGLAEAGAIDPNDAAAAWLVQHVPLTFDMGEFPTREAATARVDSLFARGIPAYVLRLPGAGGAERWQVYSGAFRDSARTAAMRALLEQAGLDAELVERTGQPVTVAIEPA